MAIKISEVYPDYVFTRLGAGKDVDAVDYKRKQYIDLEGQTIGAVQTMLSREGVKFFQIEEVDE